MERRQFLARISWTMGGLSLIPTTGVAMGSIASKGLLGLTCASDHCGDWTVDHICSSFPPYTFATGRAVPHTEPMIMTGADWHWSAQV